MSSAETEQSFWTAMASKGVVFYWLTISDEPGKVIAEGSISASEDLLRKVKKAQRATLALEDGPPLALKCVGGRNGGAMGDGAMRMTYLADQRRG